MAIGFHLDDWERESLSDSHDVYELNKQIRNLKKQLETVRVEAIKEFAERVKNGCGKVKTEGQSMLVCRESTFDSLVKEMTEE